MVAERIERSGQLALLKEMGCEAGQGYYFSKPLLKEEAARLVGDYRPEGLLPADPGTPDRPGVEGESISLQSSPPPGRRTERLEEDRAIIRQAP